MNYPKISIVTPSFNQGKYLEQTILSIISQKYPNLEYIIIDGGSTDNSLAIIKKYEKHLNHWVSEKDKGQSDAINKGLEKVTGDLFNWINSDDFLEEGALFKIAEAYNENPDKKIFCFGLNYLRGEHREHFPLYNNPQDRLQCFCNPVISQPAMFFLADAVKRSGGINPALHYSMDYELWLKCIFMYGEKSINVNKDIVASFRVHDKAKTAEGTANFINDMATILFSLSARVQLEKYLHLLTTAFKINRNYEFTIPDKLKDVKITERMVIAFLLKWKKNIYTKADFNSAKNILKAIDFESVDLTENEKRWLAEMKENALPLSWLQFRVKRKIRHILLGH